MSALAALQTSCLQLGVGDVAAVADGFALPVDRDPVAVAGLDVAVDAVVGDVELAADEPLGDRRVGPVQHLGERCVPGQPVGLLGPERQPVLLGLAVQLVGARWPARRTRAAAGRRTDFGVRVGSVISVSVVTDVASTLASHSAAGCGRQRCCAPSGRLASVAVTDPLAPLADLPGVAEASEEAREALGQAHRHRTNLRGWPTTAAEAALRAARASSVLDGGALQFSDGRRAGPTRCSPARCGWPRRWRAARRRWSGCGSGRRCRRSPGCTRWRPRIWPTTTRLGRPRGDADVGRTARAAGRHRHRRRRGCPRRCWPAVAHGELLTLAPFGTADGVVARAVSRLVTIASGLDPHGLGVPEVYWMRQSGDYRAAARGFASGHRDGLAAWLVLSCRGSARRRAGGAVDRAGDSS